MRVFCLVLYSYVWGCPLQAICIEGVLCFRTLMLVSGVFRWTLYSFKNMYEASNPLFREAVFYLVWGFLWKLGYMCSFFNLALSETESFSSNTWNLSAVDSSTDKRKTFWWVRNVNNTLEHEKVVSQHIACFWYVRFFYFLEVAIHHYTVLIRFKLLLKISNLFLNYEYYVLLLSSYK